MGGMQAWLWASRHPTMMDGTVSIAAVPAPVAGRNMMWRDMVIEAIRHDPDFHDGDYTAEPTQWHAILPLFTLMTGNARRLQAEAPTRADAMALDAKVVTAGDPIDADDFLASFREFLGLRSFGSAGPDHGTLPGHQFCRRPAQSA